MYIIIIIIIIIITSASVSHRVRHTTTAPPKTECGTLHGELLVKAVTLVDSTRPLVHVHVRVLAHILGDPESVRLRNATTTTKTVHQCPTGHGTMQQYISAPQGTADYNSSTSVPHRAWHNAAVHQCPTGQGWNSVPFGREAHLCVDERYGDPVVDKAQGTLVAKVC